MSYSLSVRGSDKADAKAKVAAAFDKMMEAQPAHAADRDQALAAAATFIDLLPDDAGMDVMVSLNGWVSGQTGEDGRLAQVVGVGVGVGATLTGKQPVPVEAAE